MNPQFLRGMAAMFDAASDMLDDTLAVKDTEIEELRDRIDSLEERLEGQYSLIDELEEKLELADAVAQAEDDAEEEGAEQSHPHHDR